jgi:hypothetical protein
MVRINTFIDVLHNMDSDALPELKLIKMPRSMEKRIVYAVKNNRKTVWHSAGRLLAAVIIIAALLSMTVCVYALNENLREYVNTAAENVKKFLTREEELIDSKAVIIDRSTAEGGVILTAEKAVRDGDTVYLYYSLENTKGEFTGTALVYDTLRLERRVLTNPRNRVRYETVYENRMSPAGLLAGDILYFLDGEPKDKINIILPITLPEGETDEYRLTITGLSGVDDSGFVSGKDELVTKGYADTLTVDFRLGDITDQLAVTELEPMTEIDIQGHILTLESIRISPIKIELSIADLTGEEFQFDGYPEYTWGPTDYLTGFWRYWSGRDSKDNKLWEDAKELNKLSYRCFIKFGESVSPAVFEGTVSWQRYPDIYSNEDRVHVTFEPAQPVYATDIECIYLERVDGIYYGAEGETIVIWEGINNR